jgi:TonB family protein
MLRFIRFKFVPTLLLSLPSVALAQPNANVVPPTVVSHVDAVYPPAALAERKHADVVLAVTVDADGHVSKIDVLESGGPVLDEAAIVAARQWMFVPAKRDGQAVASRIRVPFHFAPPAPPPELVTPPPPAEPELEPQMAAAAAPVPTPAAPAAPAPVPAAPAPEPSQVVVHGAVGTQVHGASDMNFEVGALHAVPRLNSADLLKIAPGVVLANEGGEGHAEQIFLRGFDAREGQDLEINVDGVPVNDVGNPHGNGYADTHFIIPELVESLRVTEGPYAPYQGNFAVAGSADYHLGLETRGLTTKLTYGSFNTSRALMLWGPPDASKDTFGGAEFGRTDGFGTNRAASHASAMGQYDLPLASGAKLRIGGQLFSTTFNTAGVVREDDYQSGRVGFYGTEDPLQGGDASRASLYATYERTAPGSTVSQGIFLIRRDMRIREDFTGFLEDPQLANEPPHPQRGDLLDLSFGSWTLGGRGLSRLSTSWHGLEQSLEVGYLARIDVGDGTATRNTVPGDVPYRVETDLKSTVTDIGLYADAALRPIKLLRLTGGARVDGLAYDVLDQQQTPAQRTSTGASKLMPRATAVLGPIGHFNFTMSYGEGIRAIDPVYVAQNDGAAFATLKSYEGGVTYAHDLGAVDVSARSILFDTHVDRDLIFSQTAGRDVLSNGTTRVGWLGVLRLTGSFFDEQASLTLVRPTFDDTHTQIPYVPTAVLRDDLALFHELPWKWGGQAARATLAVGYGYVGRRDLPDGQKSDVMSLLDASVGLAWKGWSTTLAAMNVLDQKYRLSEFNYASNFAGPAAPADSAPIRHFTAGAPASVFLSLAKTFGGDS